MDENLPSDDEQAATPEVKRRLCTDIRGNQDEHSDNSCLHVVRRAEEQQLPLTLENNLSAAVLEARHYVKQSLPEERQRFINNIEQQVTAWVNSLPQTIGALNYNDLSVLTDFQEQLTYLWTSFHYFILICCNESEIPLKLRVTNLLRKLLEAQNVVISVRRMMTQGDEKAVQLPHTLNFDHYYYLSIAKSKAFEQKVAQLNLESIFYKELEASGYSVAICTKDGRFTEGFHNQVSDPAQIYIYDRAYYIDKEGSSSRPHFYGCIYELSKYVHYIVDKSPMRMLIRQSHISEFCMHLTCVPERLHRFAPVICPQQVYMAFANGVYVLNEDRFITNDNPLTKTEGQYIGVPAIFHDMKFEYDKYAAVQIAPAEFLRCQCAHEHCKCPRPAILTAIDTPALDMMFATQKWSVGVILTACALFGRILHRLHVKDKLHLIFDLFGIAGSGKSTFAKLMRMILRSRRTTVIDDLTYIETPALHAHIKRRNAVTLDIDQQSIVETGSKNFYKEYVHEINNDCEPNFPLMGVEKDMLAFIAPEIRSTCRFPQAIVLKMASSETVDIHIKNLGPHNMQWTLPGLWCMNEVPELWTDNNCEMTRRSAILRFPYIPASRAQNLEARLYAELPLIILKLNRIYLAWAKFAEKRDTYDNKDYEGALQPSLYWKQTSQEFIHLMNPNRAFVSWMEGEGYMEMGADFTATKKEVSAMHKCYMMDVIKEKKYSVGAHLHNALCNVFSTIEGLHVEWNANHSNYTITGCRIKSIPNPPDLTHIQ